MANSYIGFEGIGSNLAGAADILARAYRDRLNIQNQIAQNKALNDIKAANLAVDQTKLAQKSAPVEIPQTLAPFIVNPNAALRGGLLPKMEEITPEQLSSAGISVQDGRYYVSPQTSEYLNKVLGGVAAQQVAQTRAPDRELQARQREQEFNLKKTSLAANLLGRALKPDSMEALMNPDAQRQFQERVDALLQEIVGANNAQKKTDASQKKPGGLLTSEQEKAFLNFAKQNNLADSENNRKLWLEKFSGK